MTWPESSSSTGREWSVGFSTPLAANTLEVRIRHEPYTRCVIALAESVASNYSTAGADELIQVVTRCRSI
jgi:hypothetical protein